MSRKPIKKDIKTKQFQLEDIVINIDQKLLDNAKLENKKRLESFTEYFDDGKTIKSEFYNSKDNISNGLLKQYHRNGVLEFQLNLIDLKIIDTNIETYYKNGNIHCDMLYKNGILHGLSKGYYFASKLAMEVLWDEGTAISGAYYNKCGYKKIMTQNQLNKKTIKNT